MPRPKTDRVRLCIALPRDVNESIEELARKLSVPKTTVICLAVNFWHKNDPVLGGKPSKQEKV